VVVTNAEVLARIEASLEAAGFATARVVLAGHSSVTGIKAEFRWRWMATRLSTCIAVAEFPVDAGAAELDRYLTAAADHAVENKGGGILGMQSGVAAVAVALVSSVSEEARGWASTPHGRKFAVITFPAVADLSSGAVTSPRRMIVGGIYAGYLRGLLTKHVEPQLRP
jgi:hypothetical protein